MIKSDGEISARFRLIRASSLALDFVFPPLCLGCDELGEHWCRACEKSLLPLSAPNCEICKLPIDEPGLCTRCIEERPFFDSSASLGHYESQLAKLLVILKYRKNTAIGISFAPQLKNIINQEQWNVDAIIPLPLARERYLERGYNQVEIFTKSLALYCGWPHATTWLQRAKNTPTQVGLSFEERKENMTYAFSAEVGLISGKRILLMDDVMTTGASMNSAAKELKIAGAKSVYALSIARAYSISDHDFHKKGESLLEE